MSSPLRPAWEDILLLPGQLARPPLLDTELVALETTLGRRARRPLQLGLPYFVSHMSFGALSASAKIALARVSAALDTAIGSGEGGLLPADKVTGRIAEVRGLQRGEAAHSPARFPDLHSTDDLRERVTWIRERIDGRPVGIKIAAGRVEDDLDVALEAGADFVTIDGRGGGTGAAPNVLRRI